MQSLKKSRAAFWLIALGIVGLLAFPKVWAADQVITISAGAGGGTYDRVCKDIKDACSADGLQIVCNASHGGDENIDNMLNKKADAGFAQSDTLQFVANSDPSAGPTKIQVLFPLYPEEVHVVALKDLSKTTGGIGFGKFKVGTTDVALNSLGDLEGLKVGAWGGSVTTAKTINLLGNVHFDVVPFDNDSSARKTLDAGQIAAIIAVGGKPLGFVAGLDGRYKLLKIDADLAQRVKVYQPAVVSYAKMGSTGVPTVAARSMLLVNNYQSPVRKSALAALKSCVAQNIDEFKEGTGHHPKWSDVDLNADTVWTVYNTGTPAANPMPVSKKK